MNKQDFKALTRSCCERLDLAPTGYEPTVHGQNKHSSAVCGCISSIFWIIILISIINQLNSLFGDSLNYTSNLKSAQWIKINEHFVYLKASLLSSSKQTLEYITEENKNEFGLNFTQLHSYSQEKVEMLYSEPNFISKNVIIDSSFPLRVFVDKCSSLAPECVQICSIDPAYQYLQIEGEFGSQKIDLIIEIRSKICPSEEDVFVGLKNQGIVDGFMYVEDDTFMNIGNVKLIRKILGKDTGEVEPVVNMKDYRPSFGEPESKNMTILELEVKFTGLVLEQKMTQPKIDDLIPPIIGLITLFTSIFYLFSSGFKGWSLRIAIMTHISPEKGEKLCKPTIKQWLNYFFYTNIGPLCRKKKPKRIAFTQRQLYKLDNELDVITRYQRSKKNTQKNRQKFLKIKQLLKVHSKIPEEELVFLSEDIEKSSSSSSEEDEEKDLMEAQQDSALDKRNQMKKSLMESS